MYHFWQSGHSAVIRSLTAEVSRKKVAGISLLTLPTKTASLTLIHYTPTPQPPPPLPHSPTPPPPLPHSPTPPLDWNVDLLLA